MPAVADRYKPKVEPFPRGLPPALAVPLLPNAKVGDLGDPVVPDAVKAKVLEAAKDEIADRWERWFDWHQHWHYLEPQYFTDLTADEKVQLWQSSIVMSELGEHLKDQPETRLFDRVRLSLWHYGWPRDYNESVRWYELVRTFDFGDGFETFIDYPHGWSGYGYSEHTKTYLDGDLAYLVHYKGKHVLTIGFSVCRHGVLIQQVQAKTKKGNRWMFKLGGSLLDVAVNKLVAHFGLPAWVIDGDSLGQKIRRSYGRHADKFSPEDEARVAAFYDGPLTKYRRTAETKRIEGAEYRKLEVA